MSLRKQLKSTYFFNRFLYRLIYLFIIIFVSELNISCVVTQAFLLNGTAISKMLIPTPDELIEVSVSRISTINEVTI